LDDNDPDALTIKFNEKIIVVKDLKKRAAFTRGGPFLMEKRRIV
jgi:hypothetical protein